MADKRKLWPRTWLCLQIIINIDDDDVINDDVKYNLFADHDTNNDDDVEDSGASSEVAIGMFCLYTAAYLYVRLCRIVALSMQSVWWSGCIQPGRCDQ